MNWYGTPGHPDWVVDINHKGRVVGFAIVFGVLGGHLLSQDYGPLAWGLLALQFLGYPHLLHWRTRRAAQPRQAALANLTLDSFCFGLWFAYLGFPLWATFGMCTTTTVNHSNYQGLRGGLRSVLALAGGALLGVAVFGLRFAPDMALPVTLSCMLGVFAYLVMVTSLTFQRNLKLQDTRAQLRLGEQQLQVANQALNQQLGEIQTLQARLSEQANRDSLTGLYNRRYLDDTLARELARCKREGQPLCLMLIDIDHFKRVNDTYGHPAGDEVLRALARMLDTHARSADVACRYGGEEFLMLLPHMPLETAMQRAEQWRADFGTATLVFGDFHIQATLSVGIATYPGDGTSPEMLIANADLALYRAKNNGRNRVVAFSASLPSPPLLPDPSHASQ